MSRAHPEDDIQLAVAQALDAVGAVWHHNPMGGKRNPREAARLKSHGAKAGVPDVMIFSLPKYARIIEDTPRGYAIELKAPKGRISEAQEAYLHSLAQWGWETAICYGVDQALAKLKAWGFIR